MKLSWEEHGPVALLIASGDFTADSTDSFRRVAGEGLRMSHLPQTPPRPERDGSHRARAAPARAPPRWPAGACLCFVRRVNSPMRGA